MFLIRKRSFCMESVMKNQIAHHEIPWLHRSTARPQERKQDLARGGPQRKLDINTVIGWILQAGVLLSALTMLVGIILLPSRPGGLSPERVLAFPQTLSEIGAGLLAFHPQALIALGLLLLISTPVVRVAISIVSFALERDRKYVVITSVVLTILLLSIVLGAIN